MNLRPLLALAALAAATSPDAGKDGLERLADGLRDRVAKDPMGSLVGTVTLAAYLFYRAEKDLNPDVTSFEDALVYVSTCLSVGYAKIFAVTPAGKLIGTALMTYGPALSARAFDKPERANPGTS